MNNPQPDQPKGDILIVDDILPNLQVLSTMLTEHGYEVRGAPDGSTAIMIATAEPPDLILLDIKMPDTDGYQVCRQLKEEAKTCNIPVIFISALEELVDKVKAFAVGGVDYITKPFQIEEVLARVQTHLALRNLQKQLKAQNKQLQQEISERKRAETALNQAYGELERRVKKRTIELSETNAQLKEEITQRKQAEQALRESEERYRHMFQTASVSLWEQDIGDLKSALDNLKQQGVTDIRKYLDENPDFVKQAVQMIKVLDINDLTLQIYGARNKDELLGSLEKTSAPEALPHFKEQLIAIAEQKPFFERESFAKTLSGKKLNVLVSVTIPQTTAKDSRMAVSIMDITERKRAEEALHQYTKRLRVLHEIDQAILAAQSPEEIAQAALGHIRQLVPCQRASVAIFDLETLEAVTLAISVNGVTHLGAGKRIPLDAFGSSSVLNQPQPRIVEDILAVAKPSGPEKQLLAEGIRSYINVPLISRNELIGSFNLGTNTPGLFSAEHVEIIREVADQMAIVILQARSFEAEQHQREIAERLGEVATVVNSSLELNEVLDWILLELEKVIQYDGAMITFLEQKVAYLAATRGFIGQDVTLAASVPLDRLVASQKAVNQQQPIIVPDVRQEAGFDPTLPGAAFARCVIAIPLISREETIGLLTIVSATPHCYLAQDAKVAFRFAQQVAVAIRNARLYEQVQYHTEQLEQRVADRTRELSVLYEVTAVTSQPLDLQTMLTRSLERVLVAMKSDIGIIQLLDETEEMLNLAVQQGLPSNLVTQVESLPPHKGLGWSVIEHKEPLIVPNINSDPRMIVTSPTFPQTYVGMPMRAGGRTLGVLSILKRSEQPQLNVEEIALLTSIADQIAVAVESGQLRQLAEQTAVLKERERLARDLHDSVTQLLYSANLFTEVGRELYRLGELDQLDHCLVELGEVARQALKEMRLLVYELRPPVLEQDGLVNALQHRLETVEERAGIRTRLRADISIDLTPSIEEALYRITQEALNNILKHAAATSVTVRIEAKRELVELEVIDNGSGFNPNIMVAKGGLGLASMRERAEKLGGMLVFHSTPGEGTTVKVSIRTPKNL